MKQGPRRDLPRAPGRALSGIPGFSHGERSTRHRDHDTVVAAGAGGMRRAVLGVLKLSGAIGGTDGEGMDARGEAPGRFPAAPRWGVSPRLQPGPGPPLAAP